MPIGTDDLVEYKVSTFFNGGDVDVHAYLDGVEPSRYPQYHWYVNESEPEIFTTREARHFFGVTCGMNEETRDNVVDQIDFGIMANYIPSPAPDPDPAPDDDE